MSSSPRPRAIGKKRDRPILGDRIALPRYHVLGRSDLYAALMQTPAGDSDISSLRFAICGAAPMPAALIRAFEAKTGVKILEGYGLTEGACVSSINPAAGERRAGSIGLPIPYQRMESVVLDRDGRFQRSSTRSALSRSAGLMSSRAISTPATTRASLSTSTANAGSTPAISAGETPTAIFGWPGARRSLSSEADTTSIPRSSKRRWRAIRASVWPRRSEVPTPTPARCLSPTFS